MFTPSSTFNGLANHQNGQFGFPSYISGGVAGSPATGTLSLIPQSGSGALSPPPTQGALSGSQTSLFEYRKYKLFFMFFVLIKITFLVLFNI